MAEAGAAEIAGAVQHRDAPLGRLELNVFAVQRVPFAQFDIDWRSNHLLPGLELCRLEYPDDASLDVFPKLAGVADFSAREQVVGPGLVLPLVPIEVPHH